MTSEFHSIYSEAYVWVWLPGSIEPVVAGLLSKKGQQLVFNYGRSYLERQDAIPLYEPELPLRSPEFISSWGKHVDFIRFYFETCPYKRVTGLIWLGKLTFKALNTLASSGLMVPTPDMGSDPLMETR